MKLTNKFKLPQTLMNLHDIQREAYTKGEARMSITQLIAPPRIAILRKLHYHEMVDDISDRLWAVLGTVIHTIMEQGADEEHIPEERLFAEILGWTVSGGIDVQRQGNRCKIIDYKFTKAIKYSLGDYEDWENQLNCYAYLVNVSKGWEVEDLEVAMFVRDWTKSLADTRKDYPPASCVPVQINLWSKEKQQAYLEKRVKIHKDAARAHAWDQPLPPCTDKERWKRPDEIVVKKPKNKRASRVFKGNDAENEAEEWRTKQKNADDLVIEKREDQPTRCIDNYCGVRDWCDQFQKEKDKWKKE